MVWRWPGCFRLAEGGINRPRAAGVEGGLKGFIQRRG